MSQCLRTLRDWIFFFLIMMGAAARAEWPATGVSGAARPKPVVATDTCTDSGCHDSLLRHKVLHGPVAAQKCLDCHKYQEPAEHKFTSISAPNQECTRCHDMKLKSVVHAPVQHGNCMSCHDPHGSDYPNSLRTDPAKVLCQTCHTQGRDAGRAFVHTVLANGPCSTCHETHSAENPHLLKQPVQSLCISCHKQSVPVPGEAMSTHAPAKENLPSVPRPARVEVKERVEAGRPGPVPVVSQEPQRRAGRRAGGARRHRTGQVLPGVSRPALLEASETSEGVSAEGMSEFVMIARCLHPTDE